VPPPYLTAAGLSVETTETILAEIETAERAGIGPGLSLSSASLLGQINGIFADAQSQLWEAMRAVYTQFDPDTAEGTGLDTVCAMTGTYRQAATPTICQCACVFSGGFAGATPRTLFAYVATDATRLFTNSGAIPAGASSTTYQFEAVATGPTVAPAGTLTARSSPPTGWTSITNAADAYPLGRDVETDAALRLRRAEDLAADGLATWPALVALVRGHLNSFGVSDVTACAVLVNDTDVTDANGLPPHSFEVVLAGGISDLDIATLILDSGAAGIYPGGTHAPYTIYDDLGSPHVIRWTVMAATRVYVTVHVTTDSAYGGDANLKTYLSAWASGGVYAGQTLQAYYGPGKDVIASRITAQLFSLPGVDDVPAVYIGLAAAPATSTTIDIDVRHFASIGLVAIGDIVVVHV